MRCAVEASIILVFGFVQSAADSIAAASGRHKKVKSEALIIFAFSAGSFLLSSSIEMISMSFLVSKRSKILRPVVPSFPSIKIL